MTTDAIKTYRIIEEDVNGDGKKDMSLVKGSEKIWTVYDWKTSIISWLLTTSSLIVAGLLTFRMF